jgi:hypothetical protein
MITKKLKIISGFESQKRQTSVIQRNTRIRALGNRKIYKKNYPLELHHGTNNNAIV